MNTEDKLAQAVTDWRHKHHVAADDPMIATLDLVRIYLREARHDDNNPTPPSFDDFRGTMELLDRHSKTFIHQSGDLVAELRRFGQNLRRINQTRLIAQLAFITMSILAGILIGRSL